jgi:AcrR family transcriptional regulator
VPRRYSTASRQAQTSATQRRILEAVEELVLEAGPDRVTLKGVSDRSGVALATLYKHFESRTELLAGAHRTLAGEIDAFLEELAVAAAAPGEPRAQLRSLLTRCYDALDKGGARLARIPTILGVPEIETAQARAAKRRRAILTDILRPAADAGKLILPLEEAVALGVLATTPGLWGDLIAGGQLTRDQAIDLVWCFLAVNAFGDETVPSPTKAARRPRRVAKTA